MSFSVISSYDSDKKLVASKDFLMISPIIYFWRVLSDCDEKIVKIEHWYAIDRHRALIYVHV